MLTELTCTCGKRVPVSASQCGTTATCVCGAEIAVPTLGTLRQRAGMDRLESGPISTIRRLEREGGLPDGHYCVVCEGRTSDIMTVHVECERRLVQCPPRWWTVLEGIFFVMPGPFGKLIREAQLREARSDPEIRGNDVVIDLPVRMHHDHGAELARGGQRTLERLLRRTPIYAALLDDYPASTLSLGEPR